MIEYLFARRARSPQRGEHRSGLGLICSRQLAFEKMSGVHAKSASTRSGLTNTQSQNLNQ